jgi:hypothetical protein
MNKHPIAEITRPLFVFIWKWQTWINISVLFIFLSDLSSDYKASNEWITVKWKGHGRNWSWRNLRHFQHFPGVTEGNYETPQSRNGSAEVRTMHLLSTALLEIAEDIHMRSVVTPIVPSKWAAMNWKLRVWCTFFSCSQRFKFEIGWNFTWTSVLTQGPAWLFA